MDLTMPVNSRDHVKGKKDGSVTLVEYGDFECSNCGEAYPIIKEIQKIEADVLRVVYRNFPLSEIHPHAFKAACAAEAASQQGKFWEMHDLLFENQENLEDQDLITYAKKLNLNIEQFKMDLASKEIEKHVKDDFMSGVQSGVNGTPTLYINGMRFDEPCELDILRKAIDKEKGGDING